ncbi:hypothetical protein [Kitasatospora cathayae]|uniref:Uncharacterized protein n=1 Tax=Kitasatospora cathayae TaxID=3004092 RepID=A0ABY7PZ14_9ACTN|nr:hypothetical protein [Kitasatospora sp. HUAS 3-15]WBP85191.1 hypothetical protein O1G21_04525 [Kitasatospora sp. HUAS 3-15]
MAVSTLAWPNTDGSGAEARAVAVVKGTVSVTLTVLALLLVTYACSPSGAIATPVGKLPTATVGSGSVTTAALCLGLPRPNS